MFILEILKRQKEIIRISFNLPLRINHYLHVHIILFSLVSMTLFWIIKLGHYFIPQVFSYTLFCKHFPTLLKYLKMLFRGLPNISSYAQSHWDWGVSLKKKKHRDDYRCLHLYFLSTELLDFKKSFRELSISDGYALNYEGSAFLRKGGGRFYNISIWETGSAGQSSQGIKVASCKIVGYSLCLPRN